MTSINNVIVGRIHLEHKGSWRLRGVQSGLTACMKFHAATMLSSKSKLHEASAIPKSVMWFTRNLENALKTNEDAIFHMASQYRNGFHRNVWF